MGCPKFLYSLSVKKYVISDTLNLTQSTSILTLQVHHSVEELLKFNNSFLTHCLDSYSFGKTTHSIFKCLIALLDTYFYIKVMLFLQVTVVEALRGIDANITWDNMGEISYGMGYLMNIFVCNETVFIEPYSETGDSLSVFSLFM